MSRADQELKEMIWLLQSLLDHALYGMRVKTYDDCNNCKRSKCEFMPEPGQMVRINCPLWSYDDEEEIVNGG